MKTECGSESDLLLLLKYDLVDQKFRNKRCVFY